jgi:hypothetical protein
VEVLVGAVSRVSLTPTLAAAAAVVAILKF